MSGYKTLREITEELGISRRAVHGYEKARLIAPTARNKYGHLLYDERAVVSMAVIQYFQKLGFGLKDIVSLKGEKKEAVRRELKKQRNLLAERKAELEVLIRKTDKVIETMKDGYGDFLEVIYEVIKEV